MTKKGFTLSELLITLGIIGIVSALTLPGIFINRPCENKANLIKAYNALNSVIAEITTDETLYYREDADINPLATQGAPLAINTEKAPADAITDDTDVTDKLARLVAARMNMTGEYTSAGNNYTFTTTDGTQWTFTPNDNGNNVATVNINVIGTESLPHNFMFNIEKSGGVLPARDFEKELIATPTDLKTSTFKQLVKDNNIKP